MSQEVHAASQLKVGDAIARALSPACPVNRSAFRTGIAWSTYSSAGSLGALCEVWPTEA